MIRVDYGCTACGGRVEHRVPSPPPRTLICPGCGAASRRIFAAVGRIGVASAPQAHHPRPTVSSNTALCQTNPDVPGLCHMEPSAARAWVARARKDGQGLERELERQEKTLKERPDARLEPVHHDHGHGGHTPGHTHGADESPTGSETP